jgi:nicotinate-nucleotide pyrophosphorylase (carboxylating)
MLLIEPIVRRALEEDFGRAGDVTSDLIIPEDQSDIARLAARAPGTLAGLACAQCAFRLIDSSATMDIALQDSSLLASGETIATIAGKTRAILGAERVALNFLGHLSGVATATRQLVDAVAGTKARIVCTRKTTPGLNILEKYAVRCGGGYNHRFGLDDAVLIKDNHIAAAGGIPAAVERVRRGLGHMVEVEVEVDTLEQLDDAGRIAGRRAARRKTRRARSVGRNHNRNGAGNRGNRCGLYFLGRHHPQRAQSRHWARFVKIALSLSACGSPCDRKRDSRSGSF